MPNKQDNASALDNPRKVSMEAEGALSKVSDREMNKLSKRIKVSRSVSQDDEATDPKNIPYSEKSSIKLYLQEIGKTPLLTHKEEIELAERIRNGDRQARDQMIAANLRLVVKIAYDYNNFGLPLLDLISEGNIGLIKAVERFDPAKGGKLSTYAAWWIKQSIKRALANQGKTIRLPVHLVDKIANMRKITSRLAEELGRDPSDDEVAMEMGIPVNKVAHLKSVSVRPASLDAPIGDGDDTEFGDIVGDENAINPFDNLRSKSLLNDMTNMLDTLEPREAEIIRMRYGLDGDKPRTLEEVGQEFNITRERVRQLQNMAISRMRKIMTSNERQRSAEEVKQEELERKRMEVIKEFYESKQNESEETNGS